MKKYTGLSLFVIFSFFAFPSNAQSGGSHVYEFLTLSSPARISALGGALISVKDNDLNVSFQNPSLLDSTMHQSLSLSYIDYLADIRYGYAAYARTYPHIGNFSAGIQFLDYGDFTAAAVTGEITGQFMASEYALNLGYSRPIDSSFSIGATVKTIYSQLDHYTSFGNALDLGGVYNNRKHLWTAALVIRNIGKEWKTYHIVHEPLPFEVMAGISKKVAHAPFRLNCTFTHLEKWDLSFEDPQQTHVDPITGELIVKSKWSQFSGKLARHFILGGEVLLTQNFNLRVGYNYLRRKELQVESRTGLAGFSFGFGIKVYKFNLSYGYAKYHLAGGPNHFTISTNLSDFYSRK